MDERRKKSSVCAGIMTGGIIVTFFGVPPGSFLGGVFGLKIARGVFGSPLGSEFLPRIIVLACMVTGLLLSVAAIMFLSFAAGRLIGSLLGRLPGPGSAGAAVEKIRVKE